MKYTHIYDPIALQELKEAVEWYGERSGKAVVRLVAEVDNKIAQICLHPLSYRRSFKHYREVSLRQFPYSVVYFVDEEKKLVTISSIYHHKRDPARKYIK